ncbi:MAG: hypothetical protein A2136_09380 [Chloroflexi bacterium RBG_16_54_11]|nr:MAG: hypothetical protein A2136_09380 [Chloroflexi bacterium RBG_16_54_11]
MFVGYLLVISVLLNACAQATSTSTNTPPAPAPTTPTITTAYPPAIESTEGPYVGPIIVSPVITATSPNLTPAQRAAIQSASEKYGVPVDLFTIVSTEAVTWPNGCLGVVIPGVLCTDVLVDGYRIILKADGQQFEFHTNQDGTSAVDAAQLQATLKFVVNSQDGSLQIVSSNIPVGPIYNPAFNALLPAGSSIAGTAYVYDYKEFKVVAIDDNGTRDLSFIQKPTYGLAVWWGDPGTSPMLAWGTQLIDDTHPSTLQISAPDGSQLETLITLESGATPLQALVAEFWSADGQLLYFSKEPVGIGGYIPFPSASNLFKIDIESKQVTEIIPVSPDTGPQSCLDAISVDYRFVADHCTPGVITIRDLQSGETKTIQPPDDATGYHMLGSVRFSPDGSQVAFALAAGNPDNEHGWVAVGDIALGASKVILDGGAVSFYTVLGWLDEWTILVQSTTIACSPTCFGELYTVGVDGSNPTKLADGGFLTVIDNR